MRTYLILKDRAQRWNADAEIQALAAETGASDATRYSPAHRDQLLATPFDRTALAKRGLAYERLDQLTIEVLLGIR